MENADGGNARLSFRIGIVISVIVACLLIYTASDALVPENSWIQGILIPFAIIYVFVVFLGVLTFPIIIIFCIAGAFIGARSMRVADSDLKFAKWGVVLNLLSLSVLILWHFFLA